MISTGSRKQEANMAYQYLADKETGVRIKVMSNTRKIKPYERLCIYVPKKPSEALKDVKIVVPPADDAGEKNEPKAGVSDAGASSGGAAENIPPQAEEGDASASADTTGATKKSSTTTIEPAPKKPKK